MRSATSHNRVDRGSERSAASRRTSRRVSGSNRVASDSEVLSGRINHTNRMNASYTTTSVARRTAKVRSMPPHRLPGHEPPSAASDSDGARRPDPSPTAGPGQRRGHVQTEREELDLAFRSRVVRNVLEARHVVLGRRADGVVLNAAGSAGIASEGFVKH